MTDDLFSSESVTRGHPDKLCDTISDAIVDACLAVDSNARVAVETCVKGKENIGLIVLAGEVSLNGDAPNYEAVARKAALDVGYNNHDIGMDAASPTWTEVQVHITTQSSNIAQGVNKDGLSQGAGDQGLMFGYACTETEAYADLHGRYFPLAAALSQRLTRRLTAVREQGILPWARPDGKSQVTVEYDEAGKVSRVHTVIIAIQHDKELKEQFGGSVEKELEHVRNQVKEHVVNYAIPQELLDDDCILVVNGTGRFADPGGPYADAGLTGRKIIVDTYGGMGRHGGGAFSGKDPSKVDRSAAYASRYVAKNIVAAGLADYCEIQVSYAIGVAKPTSIHVETFNSEKISKEAIVKIVEEEFDLRPKSLINMLDLKRPIYLPTAAYGHFGRSDIDLTWERTDKADQISQ